MVFVMLLSSVVYAADISNADVRDEDGEISALRCAAKGGFEFGLFLDSVIWNDNFSEGIIEPWNDILNRNQCQSMDIIGLVDAQDGIRSNIRKAFLSCENEKLPQLKSAYNKTTAEIYYVRHLIDGAFLLSLPFNIVQTRLYDDTIELDRNILYRDMKKKYVREGMFTEKEFDDFFINIEIKYQDRKKNYIVCNSGNWEQVEKKWKEFDKHFTEDYGGLKQAGEGISNQAKQLAETVETIKTVELFTTDDSFTDYIGSFIGAQINGLPPKKGITELYDAFKDNLPDNPLNSSAPAPTQSELYNAILIQDHDFDTEKMETEMMAHFSVLYGNSSEGIEIFVNELDGRTNDTNGLIEILNESLPELKTMLDGAKTINSRQCSG